jgi:hypothetical protein
MSPKVKPPPRCLAVLKLPKYEVPLYVSRARHIVQSMTGNSWFPSPRPTLPTVQLAIEALAEAEAATQGGGKEQTSTRDRKHIELRTLLEQLLAYVQSIADANAEHAPSIIEGAGMYVKKFPPGGRRGLRLKDGRVSGEVDASTDQAGDRAGYEWALSLDECVTWMPLPVTTKTRTTITGLPLGARVWVRYRASVKSVAGDWSEPVSIIVT